MNKKICAFLLSALVTTSVVAQESWIFLGYDKTKLIKHSIRGLTSVIPTEVFTIELKTEFSPGVVQDQTSGKFIQRLEAKIRVNCVENSSTFISDKFYDTNDIIIASDVLVGSTANDSDPIVAISAIICTQAAKYNKHKEEES